jgi:hypothetical protein
MMTTEERRKPLWCGIVQKAIEAAAASGRPVDIEATLNSIGILRWSKYRSRAVTYARKVLAAGSGGDRDEA